MNDVMDFEKRLERAIERGQNTRHEQGRRAAERAMTEDDLRSLHTSCRLELSDHIENCLRQLADRFPGFQFETIVGEEGWGAKITRDDIARNSGRGFQTLYSRLLLVVAPFSDSHIVALNARGTIRNKETVTRNHFQYLSQLDIDSFRELIDLWILEYAEQYAATA
jgi:hypothetical protein